MSEKVNLELKPFTVLRILALLEAMKNRWHELEINEVVREFHQEVQMKINIDHLDDAQMDIEIQEILKNN